MCPRPSLAKHPSSTSPFLEKGLGDLWRISVTRVTVQAAETRCFIWDRKGVKWGGECKVLTLNSVDPYLVF